MPHEGEAPLTFLFSGSVFYCEDGGSLQIEQILDQGDDLPTPGKRMALPDGSALSRYDWLRLDTTRSIVSMHTTRAGAPDLRRRLLDLLDMQAKEVVLIFDHEKEIADAIPYEGYILYPIALRPSKIGSAGPLRRVSATCRG